MKRLLSCALLLSACGGGGSPTTPASPSAPVVSVGGDYTTAVAFAENTCGAVEIAALPTRIQHTPGSSSLQLTHGATYACTLSAAAFACQPQTFAVNGRSETVTVAGTFRTTGFDATASVAVAPNGCSYAVRWTGTKQGSPNVLP